MSCEDVILLNNDGEAVEDDYAHETQHEQVALSSMAAEHISSTSIIPSSTNQPPTADNPNRLAASGGCFSLVARASLVAALGGLLFGYDVGVVGGALLQLRRQMALSCWQSEAVVSVMMAGALVASLLGGVIVDWAGRRASIVFNAVLFVVGACVLALANNITTLLVGRFVVGFAVCLSAISECVYISEIAPDHQRGRLVSLNELAITAGFLISYLTSHVLIHVSNGWRYMFGVAMVPALVQAVAMLFLPSTPHFLLLRKKDAQAERVLQMLSGRRDVKQQLTHVRLSVNSLRQSAVPAVSATYNNSNCCCCGGVVIEGAVIAVSLVIFQQLSGQPSVLNYAPTVLQLVGFCADSAATMATVGLGVVKLLMTAVVLLLVDRVGRRRLLLTGTCVMSVCLLILAAVTSLHDQSATMTAHVCSDHVTKRSVTSHTPAGHVRGPSDVTSWTNTSSVATFLNSTANNNNNTNLININNTNLINNNNTNLINNNNTSIHNDCSASAKFTWRPLVALASLMGCVGGYSIGFGPVTWLLLSELFPPAVKGRAVAACSCVNWLVNMLVAGTLLQAAELLSPAGLFASYAFVCLLACVFIFLAVPETRNQSLHEISLQISRRGLFARGRGHISRFCGVCGGGGGRGLSYSQLTSTSQSPGSIKHNARDVT